MKRHSAVKYDCVDCGLGFKEFNLLFQHFQNDHKKENQKLFPCYDCKRVFRERKFAQKHKCDPPIDVFKRKIIYNVECPDCDKKCQNDEEMLCHKLTYCVHICGEVDDDTNKVYKCQQCDEEFANDDDVLTHQSTLCKKSFRCNVCGKRYRTLEYRNRHFNRTHRISNKPTPEKCVCDICGAALKTKCLLKKHKNLMHDPTYVRKIVYFNCTVPGCGKVVHSKHGFENHMGLHLEELKYFECYLCPRKFRNLNSIRGHVCTHASDPDAVLTFVCDFCQKRFVNQRSLNTHRKHHIYGNFFKNYIAFVF
jgi:hypothetical protein